MKLPPHSETKDFILRPRASLCLRLFHLVDWTKRPPIGSKPHEFPNYVIVCTVDSPSWSLLWSALECKRSHKAFCGEHSSEWN